jgi:HAE1 family hydrophobic/amphiphilic exporter-1
MQWLARVCVRRPTFAWVLTLVVVVLGAAGYRGLGVDQFPNIDFPVVIVLTRLPGAAPEEVESDVSDKIEGALNTIGGIEELRSMSSEGVSQVVVQFSLDRDIDGASQDVRDRVATILHELPQGIDPPTVGKVDPASAPILLVAVRSNLPIRETTEIADKQIRRRIESIAGVGQVTLIGGKKREVLVWLDPLALRAAGLTPATVQAALATQNVSAPGGRIETGPENLALRVEGRLTRIEDFEDLVVAETEGRAIRLSEVARIEDFEAEETSLAQLDDERTVVLAIRKQSGENTVAVVDTLKQRLTEVGEGLPSGVSLEIVRDNSAVIRTGIDAVSEHLVLGALLAALVVLIFLGNARSTVIAALAIPISIVGTFGMMKLAGFSLNFLTLLALALAVGIVIDDAIVVLENVVRHIEEKREKPFVAAVLATKEIGLAVLATTLSLAAVFVPVAFMAGIVGEFLMSFGITMAFAILMSMLVSFSLTPMLCARWLQPHREGGERPLLTRVVDVVYRPIERAYMWVLGVCMRRRWIVVVASFAALGSCIPVAKSLPAGFIPPDDRGQFEVSIRAPEGTSVTETKLIAERISRDVRKLFPNEVTRTLLMVGDDAQESSNLARVNVYLTDPKEREINQRALMDEIRKQILPSQPKELTIRLAEISEVNAGAQQANIMWTLSGPDMDVLAEHATRMTEKLKEVPGAVDVTNTLVVGKPSLAVSIDRDRAADLGVRVADVANTLRIFVGGTKVTTYPEGGEQYDVRLRAEARYRADAESLNLISVPSMKHGSVPVASLVDLQQVEGPAQIDRLARRRQITILANAAPGTGDSSISEALKQIARDENLPPGYTLQPAGFSKETEKMGQSFLIVIAMAFVFMYLVLAAQFESWIHPVTILLCLPLTVPFALISLKLLGETVNLFSGLGILVLFGVVKKNAILQIDHTNHLRSKGMDRMSAILEANRDRLRPILMTTLAFVAGMVPLAFSRGIGSGLNRAIAGVVIGGQTFSLLLTLLATPVAYAYFDDLSNFVGRIFARIFKRGPVDRGEEDLAVLLGDEDEQVVRPAAE